MMVARGLPLGLPLGNFSGNELSRSKQGYKKQSRFFGCFLFQKNLFLVGVPGIEPGSLLPQSSVLPLYYTPQNYLPSPLQRAKVKMKLQFHRLRFPSALIHLVQAFTLLPEGKRTHCKLGCFLFLMVGLYFPLNFTLLPTIVPFFPQIAHCLPERSEGWKRDLSL